MIRRLTALLALILLIGLGGVRLIAGTAAAAPPSVASSPTPAASPSARAAGAPVTPGGNPLARYSTNRYVLHGAAAAAEHPGAASNAPTPRHATAAVSGTANWVQQCVSCAPPPRDAPGMAYDTATQSVVLFGGYDTIGPIADTWTYTGSSSWTNVNPPTSPSNRWAPAMASDGAGHIVLFGGFDASNAPLGDTWIFNGTTWANVSPTQSPPARGGASLAYDAANGMLILFGGAGCGSICSDTWSFDGHTWTNVSTAGPSPRQGAGMVYDPATRSLILFGGGANNVYVNDTWSWNGTWTNVSPATSPSMRQYPGLAYDTAAGAVVLFGGVTQSGLAGDTWAYNGSIWTDISAGVGNPPARVAPGMPYDDALGSVVLFGGLGAAGQMNDTCTLTGPLPIPNPSPSPNPSSSPNPSASPSPSPTPNPAAVIIWVNSLLASPTPVPGASIPPRRNGAGMAFSPPLNSVVLFGGALDDGSLLADTWLYNLRTNTWTAFCGTGGTPICQSIPPPTPAPTASPSPGASASPTPTAAPFVPVAVPPRWEPAMSFHGDGGGDLIVMFGGETGSANDPVLLSDTWTFTEAGWDLRCVNLLRDPCTGGSPFAREGARLAHDTAHAQTIMYGGCCTNTGNFAETWQFSNSGGKATWTSLTVGVPSARQWPGLAYEPNKGGLLLFGGVDNFNNTLGDTWFWNGVTWAQQLQGAAAGSAPPPRYAMGLAEDAARNNVVLFGGACLPANPVFSNPAALCPNAANGNIYGDTWVWNGTSWINSNPTTSPPARLGFEMVYDTSTVNYGGQKSAMVLFGGLAGSGNGGVGNPPPSTGTSQNDTWLVQDLQQGNLALTSVFPAAGPAGGGTVIAITGSNFSTTPGSTIVMFGSNAATAVTCSSATRCSAISPVGSGAVGVSVNVNGRSSGTNAAIRFSYSSVPGDVNGDGSASAVDALCILRGVAGLPATPVCPGISLSAPTAADVNGDGTVNAVDALCALRSVAGLQVTRACSPPAGAAAPSVTPAQASTR
ncbi:MAG: Kelch repeat-containing protein [Dehalococcoidia bacterium]